MVAERDQKGYKLNVYQALANPEGEAGRTVEQFLTVKFKLHNPSQRKRAMMDYAMRQAHLAFDKVLKTVREDVEEIVATTDKKERKAARATLTKRMQDIVRPLPMGSGPKQASIMDAGAQIDSYIALRDADKGDVVTGYPTAARLDQTEDEAYAIALERLITSTTKQDEDEARDEMARARHAGTARPLGIYKNRVDDGMLILSDDNDRLFAYINLISSKSRYAHKVDMTGLIDTRTGEVMTKKAKPAQGVLVPLQSSVWHQRKFLETATLQSGKLIKEDDEYLIACSFKFSSPARPDPVNYLGVDRGIEMLAAWSVISPDGDVIERGSHDGAGLRAVQRQAESEQADTQRKGKVYSKHTRLAAADIEVHACANAIVAAAIEHNARVVFEDLSAINNGQHMKRKKGARKGGFRRMLTRSQYQKLQHAVGYKLRLAGFDDLSRSKPPFHEVHAAFTSTTCSACGHNDKANRPSQAEFVCTNCGYEDNADLNAAANIASKGQHFDEVISGRKKGQKLKEHERWSNWRSSKAGSGRENGLVLGSVALSDACMSEPSSPCGQAGSKVTAEEKRDDASSSDREHHSIFGTSSDKKENRNKAVQHDLFQKG